MSTSDLEQRNLALSMRRSVENLVISSQDAIGQSISQALSLSGVIPHQQHSSDNRSVSRSPSPGRRASPAASLAAALAASVAVPESPEDDKNEAPSFASAADSVSLCSALDAGGARGAGGPRAKKKSWYSALYPTYKSRSEDFKRVFKELPDEERLIADYSCALQKDILAHGRLYASQNYLCFYANIFGWETNMCLRWKDVTAITKEKTALVFPNAILVSTDCEKNFLTSFSGRDKAYLMLFRVWQNALMGQQMSSQEIWHWVRSCYGEELGFNSDEEDCGREVLDDDKTVGRLAADSISEDYLDSSSLMDAGGGGGEAGGEAASSASLSERVVFARSDSQPPPITLTPPVNGSAYGDGDDDGDALPTDVSDSSDSDRDKPQGLGAGGGAGGGAGAGPARCLTPHEGRSLLQTEVPVNVDQLFTMLFTNSKFCLELLAARDTCDYVQSAWKHNAESGLKCRQVSYTLALTNPIGPKSVHVTETQVMNKWSRPGQAYSVDISTVNMGVPYADSFYVVIHYCLQRRGDASTALALYGTIKYKKSVWGIVKGFIEKNTWAGLEDFVRQLQAALERDTDSERALTKRKGKRRRRATSSSQETSAPSGGKSASAGGATSAPAPRAPPAPLAARAASRWLLAVLLLLLLLNLLLYWRLYHTRPASFIVDRAHFDEQVGELSGERAAEWARLLEHATHQRRDQLHSWRDALHHAIDTLRQTEQALGNLLDTIRPSLEQAQAAGAGAAGADPAPAPAADPTPTPPHREL